VHLLPPAFVDTSPSATLPGDNFETCHQQLCQVLPIRRAVGARDVAALAVHLMINSAVTGAMYDIDGRRQFITGYC
jgi:hypothetical protein